MNNEPLVSIIIPSYNHSNYIGETLDSIINDNYSNKEIIIIDDGSKDNSVTIIENWITKHPNEKINFSVRENKGVCYTLNELVDNANGKYLVLLASDDVLINNTIKERVKLLEENPSKLVLISDAEVIDNNGNTIYNSLLSDFHNSNKNNYYTDKDILQEILFNFSISGATVILNRDIYKITGKYPEHLKAEDLYFYGKAAAANKIMFYDKIVSEYRWHGENASYKNPNLIKSFIKTYSILIFDVRGIKNKIKIGKRIMLHIYQLCSLNIKKSNRPSLKLLFLLILTFLLSSCIVDVGDGIDVKIIDAKELSSLVQNINLTQYPSIQDTVDIPIFAYWGVDEKYNSYNAFKEERDAGFHLQYYPYSSANKLQEALDYAQQAGIKLLISCPELYINPEQTVKLFKNHPANGGYFIRDEPGNTERSLIIEMVKKIKDIDSSKLCYINLLPNYTDELKDKSVYADYIYKYTTEVPLDIISFDYYPIVGNSLRYSWYDNLEIIKQISEKENVPFWAFALTLKHFDYPKTDLNQLRLQVYSNLAYGAKGIEYFTYSSVEGLGTSQVDLNGNITDAYYYVKEMNQELQNLSYIFLSSKNVNIFHYNSKKNTSPLNLTNFFQNISIRGGSALISELQNNSSSFLIIQNNNLYHEIGITIKNDPTKNINFIIKDGHILPVSLINEEFKLTPGDIVIFSK